MGWSIWLLLWRGLREPLVPAALQVFSLVSCGDRVFRPRRDGMSDRFTAAAVAAGLLPFLWLSPAQGSGGAFWRCQVGVRLYPAEKESVASVRNAGPSQELAADPAGPDRESQGQTHACHLRSVDRSGKRSGDPCPRARGRPG